jgi:CheY-like chemotaxis protein
METFYPTVSGRGVLILVIEDENVSRRALARLLAARGYITEAVGTAEEAVAILAVGQPPQVALVDLDLPGMSGAELLPYLTQRSPPVRAILLTAASEERIKRTIGGRMISYLRKPINFNDLLHTLDAAQSPA